MRLGLLTDCLPDWTLREVAEWAATHGYDALEVAAWPVGTPGHASHLDVAGLDDGAARATRAMLEGCGVSVSAVSYYGNLLDPERGPGARAHLQACIDAAGRLGVGVVGTFLGRDPRRTIAENVAAAEVLVPPLVADAARCGVVLAVENCPMTSWHPDGAPGNLAYSPELWGWAAELGLRLNFDPSHLPTLGIDPVAALRSHLDLVVHVQAKDVETFPQRRDRTGYHGPVLDGGHGWWRYRTPGRGELDWLRIIDVLAEHGYDGAVAVEHEDPVFAGSPAAVTAGLEIAAATLRPLVR